MKQATRRKILIKSRPCSVSSKSASSKPAFGGVSSGEPDPAVDGGARKLKTRIWFKGHKITVAASSAEKAKLALQELWASKEDWAEAEWAAAQKKVLAGYRK